MLSDFIALIFPHLCSACDDALYKNESVLCTSCRFKLPQTNFHLKEDNPVARLFWGKAEVHAATAFYYFRKGDRMQKLMHGLKYKGRQDIGVELGRIMGASLATEGLFTNVDIIVPVPLHPKRQRKRGYNQATCLASGMAETMNRPYNEHCLYRALANPTQTRKGKFERWQNVESVFALRDAQQFENKHLLLVDDVVTTGSTLEACAHQLNTIPGTRVSIATAAFA